MPSLSVTIIARNEEQNLPRALASVAPLDCEVVVVDTGSTDRTLEIAREFGARTSEFLWIDDFSAAHNFCNSLAKGEWLLMLDADEELLAESHAELWRCIDEPHVLALGVLRQDLVDADRPDCYTEMWQMRLFRNRPDLRFAGRFHHHFSPPLEQVAATESLTVRESNVRLRHYGYLSTLKAEKDTRAVRLLELELADRPGQFYYLVELGMTKLSQRDQTGHTQLAEAAQMVVDGQQQASGGPLAMLVEHALAYSHLPADFPLSRTQAREIALRRFPTAVPLLWQLAAEHNQQLRFAECAKLLERIIALGQTHSYDRTVSFNPAIAGDDALLNLGICYVRMCKLRDAERCFRQLKNSPTRRSEAAENLQAIARLKRR
jgi:hypothetical protein